MNSIAVEPAGRALAGGAQGGMVRRTWGRTMAKSKSFTPSVAAGRLEKLKGLDAAEIVWKVREAWPTWRIAEPRSWAAWAAQHMPGVRHGKTASLRQIYALAGLWQFYCVDHSVPWDEVKAAGRAKAELVARHRRDLDSEALSRELQTWGMSRARGGRRIAFGVTLGPRDYALVSDVLAGINPDDRAKALVKLAQDYRPSVPTRSLRLQDVKARRVPTKCAECGAPIKWERR